MKVHLEVVDRRTDKLSQSLDELSIVRHVHNARIRLRGDRNGSRSGERPPGTPEPAPFVSPFYRDAVPY